MRRWGKEELIVGVYVDDLIVTSTHVEDIDSFKHEIAAHFRMSDLSALSYYLDIKSMFLNGELVETVFVKQASGFAAKGAEHMVLKLRKALYWL